MTKHLHYIPEGQEALYRAAPELLTALKDALEWLEGLDPEANKANDGLSKIRAAIAKAEGQPERE